MQKCSNEKWEAEEQKIVDFLSRRQIAHSANWLQCWCPKCKEVNWALLSEVTRFEACSCFNCEEIFWLSQEIYENYKTELVLSNVFDYQANEQENITKGLKDPRI